MKGRNLKILSGLFSIAILISLIIKLIKVPGGMILSGLFMGSITIIGILIGCLILVLILKIVFKNYSFLALYSITTAISFLIFHCYLYSPTLKIIVPKGYTGEVSLVLSNVDNNLLRLDSNGIGYINKWTFNKTYTEPIVVEQDGRKVNYRCVGFNPSTFWGLSKFCCVNGKVIKSISFEIVPENKQGQKQYYSRSLAGLVDVEKLYNEK